LDNGTLLLINGPNLNLLGTREPEVYGHTTLADIEGQLLQFVTAKGFGLKSFQSNHEGELIDFLQAEGPTAAYGIINLGAYTHTSVAFRDALKSVSLPFIETHISNVYAREPFRHHSYLSDISQGVIVGLGTAGYQVAAQIIVERLLAP